jgi:hypothetical protein
MASVADVIALIIHFGELHDRRERSLKLAGSLQTELASVQRTNFTFACPIWKNPLYIGAVAIDSFRSGDEGGRPERLHRTPRYPQLGLAEVLAMNPENVVLPRRALRLHGTRRGGNLQTASARPLSQAISSHGMAGF